MVRIRVKFKLDPRNSETKWTEGIPEGELLLKMANYLDGILVREGSLEFIDEQSDRFHFSTDIFNWANSYLTHFPAWISGQSENMDVAPLTFVRRGEEVEISFPDQENSLVAPQADFVNELFHFFDRYRNVLVEILRRGGPGITDLELMEFRGLQMAAQDAWSEASTSGEKG